VGDVLRETQQITSLAQLRDTQINGPGAGLPRPPAVAVTLGDAIRRALAVAGAAQRVHLKRHQPLGGKGNHFSQEFRVGSLLKQALKGHSVFVSSPYGRLVSHNLSLTKIGAMATRRSGPRAPVAYGSLHPTTATAFLHHSGGRT